MKWSYHSQATPSGARITALRSRFGRTQQLVALALTLSLCIVAALAVSGRVNLAPGPTLQPTAQAILFPPTLVAANTSAPVATPRAAGTAATAAPQAAKFDCGNGTAEGRYVADRSGVIVFDGPNAGAGTVGTIAFRASVQMYGTVPGRLTGNSDKWYAVRFGARCAYVWADPADSRLSKTQPK